MKRVLEIIVFITVVCAVMSAGFFIRNLLLDRKIEQLETTLATNNETIKSYAYDNARKTDLQSETDIKFMQYVFDEIFTFYDIEDFKRARNNALAYGFPESFVNNFYDMSELASSMYTEAMLDIMCKYESSEFYLLDRYDGVGYYFGVITLNTVKYNTSFPIAVFVSISDSGDETERMQSIVYYNVD